MRPFWLGTSVIVVLLFFTYLPLFLMLIEDQQDEPHLIEQEFTIDVSIISETEENDYFIEVEAIVADDHDQFVISTVEIIEETDDEENENENELKQTSYFDIILYIYVAFCGLSFVVHAFF